MWALPGLYNALCFGLDVNNITVQITFTFNVCLKAVSTIWKSSLTVLFLIGGWTFSVHKTGSVFQSVFIPAAHGEAVVWHSMSLLIAHPAPLLLLTVAGPAVPCAECQGQSVTRATSVTSLPVSSGHCQFWQLCQVRSPRPPMFCPVQLYRFKTEL